MIRTREEAIKQCEDFIENHSEWSVEVEWANGVEFVLEDYKRLIKQEPKISKEKAIEILKADNIAGYSVEDILNARDMAIKAIKQEPRKGYWLHRPHVYGVTYCSICDFELKIDNTNYCPNCGADMREVEE